MVRHLSSRPHGTSRRSSLLRQITVAAALICVVTASQASCDNNARFVPIPFNFKEVEVIGAVPAVQAANGEWAPLCRLETEAGQAILPDGVLLNTVFLSDQRDSQAGDKDIGLRPGDRVNNRTIQGSGIYDVDLTDTSNYESEIICLEPSPDQQSPPSDIQAASYACVTLTCTPSCESKVCGSDNCGGTCGDCADAERCNGGACEACTPDCSDKACGDDGCGGSCGACPAGDTCNTGACCTPVPVTDDQECGDDADGCSVGVCPSDESCENNICQASTGPCGTPCLEGQACMLADDCDGFRNPSFTLSKVRYKAFTEARSNHHNVLVLVDQSGSTKGLVDKDNFKEGRNVVFSSNFGDLGSDKYDLRHTAVTKFVGLLNGDDAIGIIGFGEGIDAEGQMTVPCQSPEGQKAGEVQDTLDVCFGTDRDMWVTSDCQSYAPNGNAGPDSYSASQLKCQSDQCQRLGNCTNSADDCVTDEECEGGTCSAPALWGAGESWKCGNVHGNLKSAQQGRSNLWSAVDEAYEYLRRTDDQAPNTVKDNSRSKHIVVVTDGPDTCDPDSETFASCQTEGPCGTARLSDVLARIDADIATLDDTDPNNNLEPIAIHFVQFESLGYRGRDPRQMEVSCLTGGHYQFINSEDLPKLNSLAFEEALDQALQNVRYSMMGYWQFAHGISALTLNGAIAHGNTPPGSLFSFSGVLTIEKEMNLSKKELDEKFNYGISNIWDRRPTVGKPCQLASDCAFLGGTPGAATDCHIVCSAETGMCPASAAGVAARNRASCLQTTQEAGFCCDGMCVGLGDSCDSCEDSP